MMLSISTKQEKKINIGRIKHMKIINNVDNDVLQAFGYEQWVEQFVKDVISQAKLECEEVTIEDVEHSKRIYLSVDSKEYMIRTWNFHPVERDNNNDVCAEMVDYTLFEIIENGNGGHGNEISNGMLRIAWKN